MADAPREKVCFLSRLIHAYRFMISLLFGHCCRFEPTCSMYALQALQKYGYFKGCYLLIWRLMRCHPWHSGGVDPVP